MGWAAGHIARLQKGETISFRPKGNSMVPRIHSGDLVTVEPVHPEQVNIGDVVLCTVGRADYLHYVRELEASGDVVRFTIENAKGRINGRTLRVYGRVVKVER